MCSCWANKVQEEAGPELGVFDDGGCMTMKVSRELGGGSVGRSDLGRRLQASW